jgi:peroxiredoxin
VSRFVDLRRGLIGAALVSVLLVPAYLLLMRGEDAGIARARLLDTPGDGSVGIENGKRAPDFELPAYDGGSIRLSGLRGRPVLINFWATWCGSCLSKMPEIAALQEQRGAGAVAVLAINAGEGGAAAGKFIDFLGAPFVYGLDADLVIADAYGVYGLPMSVFLDAEGIVRAVYRGHADRARLEAYLDAAVQSREPPELPLQIRTVSTIPRERVLSVSTEGSGRIELRSRSLRCDSSYCPQAAVASLEHGRGVISTSWSADEALPLLHVRFDAAATSPEAIVAALTQALEAAGDPVYDRPFEVRYED